jgi:hypothetical protein
MVANFMTDFPIYIWREMLLDFNRWLLKKFIWDGPPGFRERLNAVGASSSSTVVDKQGKDRNGNALPLRNVLLESTAEGIQKDSSASTIVDFGPAAVRGALGDFSIASSDCELSIDELRFLLEFAIRGGDEFLTDNTREAISAATREKGAVADAEEKEALLLAEAPHMLLARAVLWTHKTQFVDEKKEHEGWSEFNIMMHFAYYSQKWHNRHHFDIAPGGDLVIGSSLHENEDGLRCCLAHYSVSLRLRLKKVFTMLLSCCKRQEAIRHDPLNVP